MITVKTYIRVKEVSPYTFPYEDAPKFFIDMEDEERFEELREIFHKGGNIYGSIVIANQNEIIVSYDVIDRFPLYWVIWFDLLRNYILKIDHEDHYAEIEHYFALIRLVDEIEIYCYYEDFIVKLPEKEFLLAMLEGCHAFYRHFNRIILPHPDHDYLKKVEELIEIVKRDF